MDTVLEILSRKIGNLLHSEAQITKNDRATVLIFPNLTGGRSQRLESIPGEDLKLALRKTSRFYERESGALERLLRDIEKYAAGQIVLLDYTARSGEESNLDRIASATDAAVTNLDGLIDLCIHCNLIHSDALADLLAAGGTLNVHFWDSRKDFYYKLKGRELVKESVSDK